jgi:hypothetical protein
MLLLGRHFCPFAPGFRKTNGNGLLSTFGSLATLSALQGTLLQFMHRTFHRLFCPLSIAWHRSTLSAVMGPLRLPLATSLAFSLVAYVWHLAPYVTGGRRPTMKLTAAMITNTTNNT